MKNTAAIIIPDVLKTQQQPQSLERLLIFGMLKSLYFYRRLRTQICPFDPAISSYRPDFVTPTYNRLFPVIASWWDKFDAAGVTRDFSIPLAHLEAFMFDCVNRRVLSLEDAQALKAEIWEDYDNLEFTPELYDALATCPAYQGWLEGRVAGYEIRKLHAKIGLKPPTIEDLKAATKAAEKSITAIDRKTVVNGSKVLLGQVNYFRPLETGFKSLDEAIGGGLVMGETTMMAAINGGGKTVLAMQAALELGKQMVKTLILTTEQSPADLILRMLSNFTNTEFSEFTLRKDITPENLAVGEERAVNLIPPYMWDNPILYDKIVQLNEIVEKYVYFIDWSRGQGYSFESHFDQEIEKLEGIGWNPNVLIIDWVGGGLEKMKNRDQLRHYYTGAVDHIVNHCKRTKRASIIMAQFDKAKVRPGTKVTRMDMLSENKTMTNNVTNFLGLSALRGGDDTEVGKPVLLPRQYLYVEKARKGQGGLVPIDVFFKFQRFNPVDTKRLIGGG